ncbi:MAG TPA: hypothetical protein VIC26_11215, partial [Marinagarivorans sp.]
NVTSAKYWQQINPIVGNYPAKPQSPAFNPIRLILDTSVVGFVPNNAAAPSCPNNFQSVLFNALSILFLTIACIYSSTLRSACPRFPVF